MQLVKGHFVCPYMRYHLNVRWRTKTGDFVVAEAVAEGKEASENGLQG